MTYLNDPKHWLDRAKKTRVKADLFRYDEELRQRLLRVAREYDRLADHAAERAKANALLDATGARFANGKAPNVHSPYR